MKIFIWVVRQPHSAFYSPVI